MRHREKSLCVTHLLAPAAKRKAKAGRGGKTIEQIYQKKTQLEHILMRPDTYIGAVEEQSDKVPICRCHS